MNISENVQNSHYLFSLESPLSHQDLVSWKMALDKRQLPEVDKNVLPRLFHPNKPVTERQAALALSTGDYAEVVMEELARIEAEKIAEAAVNAHGALVAQVEK